MTPKTLQIVRTRLDTQADDGGIVFRWTWFGIIKHAETGVLLYIYDICIRRIVCVCVRCKIMDFMCSTGKYINNFDCGSNANDKRIST